MSKNHNMSGIIPTGGKVLILPKDVEQVTEGGIIIPETVRDQEQKAATDGVVIDVGRTAWLDIDDGVPWAMIGDTVCYARYAGVTKEGKDGKIYLLLNDTDIIAKLV